MTRLRELWSRQRSVIIGSLGILFNLLYLTLDYLENPQHWSARLAQEFAQEPWLYIGLFLLIPLFVAIAVLLERTERERRRFQTLFEAASDGIYVRDLDGASNSRTPNSWRSTGFASKRSSGGAQQSSYRCRARSASASPG
jgi:PAS domain-containing protein